MSPHRVALLCALLLSACNQTSPEPPAAPATPSIAAPDAAPDAAPAAPDAGAASGEGARVEEPAISDEDVLQPGQGGASIAGNERGGGRIELRGGQEVIQLARVDRVKKSVKPRSERYKGIEIESGDAPMPSAAKPSVDLLNDVPRGEVSGIDGGLMERVPRSNTPSTPRRPSQPKPPPRPRPEPRAAQPKERPAPVIAPPQAAPSEAVVAGNEFKDHGVNPMTKTAQDALSTFSVDVDTGAYTIARRQINAGYRPAPASVRVEEYVNYFAYNYPAPKDGPFSVSMEVAPSPFDATAGRYLMRVGVQGKQLDQRERKPVHLTFLVDISGSMDSLDRLPLAKQSLKLLTNTLREGDTVALVTYAGDTRVVLPATDATYKAKILTAIDMLYADGSTAMGSGLTLAYQQAARTHRPGEVSRVIILSDGDTNVGHRHEMYGQIEQHRGQNITLSAIGFGDGNYKDNLMEQLANSGDGNYYYIDSPREAIKVFGEQVHGTLEVIAKDVKLQVEFDPARVESYRLIGYENRDIADKDFRNDKVDAGEIGAGHTVTAFYELVLKGEPAAGLATVRVRHKQPEGDVAAEQVFAVTLTDLRAKLSYASLDFQFSAAVVAFAELLRGSPYAGKLTFALVEELASAASSPNQTERQEFISMVKAVRRLVGE
jgi:Ca-activated chloride channel family protein